MAHSLIVDLLMRTGSFETDTARAAKTAQRRAKEIERAFSDAGAKLRGAFGLLTGGLGFAGLMRSFVQETIDAQNEQAQLAAVLKSTEQAAGFSADALNRMANELARRSIFSEGDLTRAQTRLLSYTGIVGRQFPAAMQAVIDMAARMGMSVEQSAETIGRALDVPSKGLAALSQQGFRFTETQKAAVLELERTGRQAEAQAVVLAALQASYGGAAEAARGTLGGALTALQSELRTLMTGSEETLPGMTAAIENLTQTLASSESKAAFASMTTLLADLATVAARVGGAVAVAGPKVSDFLSRAAGTDTKLQELRDLARFLGVEQPLRDFIAPPRPAGGGDLAKQLGVGSVETAAGLPAPVKPPDDAELKRLAEAARQREAAAKQAAENERRIKAYTENLQKQLQATENLSVAETVLADIQAGRLGRVTGRQRVELLGVAEQIDAALRLAEATAESERRLTEGNRRVQESFDTARQLAISVEAPVERLNRRYAELNELARTNPFVAGDSGLLERLRNQAWSEFAGNVGKATEKIDDFGRKFAENAQDLLGETLLQTWKGSTDNLLKLWGDMLLNMLAQAQAANLARALFGTDSSGNLGGTWLTTLGSAIAGYFGASSSGVTDPGYRSPVYGTAMATGTNYVPYDGFRAVLHEGEAVVPKQYNPAAGAPVGGGGPRVQVINNVAADTAVATREAPDGRLIVEIERRVVGVVAADAARGGAAVRAISGRIGGSLGSSLTRRRG